MNTDSDVPTVAEVVAERVRHYRKRAGLSQQGLADAMTALGRHTERLTVTRIEQSRRSVAIEELLLLAAALDVPPLLLFLGLGQHNEVRLGDDGLHPEFLRKWCVGESRFARHRSADRRALSAHGDNLKWRSNAWTLSAYSHLSELFRRVEQIMQQMGASLTRAGIDPPHGPPAWPGGPAPLDLGGLLDLSADLPSSLVRSCEETMRTIAEHMTTMRQRGLLVDGFYLPEGWFEQMAVFGIEVGSAVDE